MKLARFAPTTLLSILFGCSVQGSFDGSLGGGGSGGSNSGMAQASSGASSASNGSSAAGSTGGAGGTNGHSDFCDEVPACGDFGNGCIGCAARSLCAAPYETCFASEACGEYSSCIEPCAPEDSACRSDCAQANSEGAAQWKELVACVVCDQCPSACPDLERAFCKE